MLSPLEPFFVWPFSSMKTRQGGSLPSSSFMSLSPTARCAVSSAMGSFSLAMGDNKER